MLLVKCSCLKCNKISSLSIKNKAYCLNHSLLLYNKYVLIIQKFYRGYKARRYLVNIVYKLPIELQEKICYYINENYYKKKHKNTLRKIIIKNTYNFHNYKNLNEKFSINYLYNCYKLYNKYHSIIDINYLKHAYILSEQILYLCDILLHQEYIILGTPYSYLIFDKIQLFNLDQNVIFNLIDIIYQFTSLYTFNYNLKYILNK
tara:strand:- start:133 stop:744 length:612 start_codon:yes stop_codon:yes gene_type:complete